MGRACEYNQLSSLIAARHISSEEQGEMDALAGYIIRFARKILKNQKLSRIMYLWLKLP